MELSFKVNGESVRVDVKPDEMLLDVLRREFGLTSVRQTCGIGICGACTALVDGEPISACIMLAPLVQGAEITTVEGLGGDHPVQEAFVEAEAFQCGYCTPGQVCSAVGMLGEAARGWPSAVTSGSVFSDERLDDAEVRERMSGNLCRFGAYPNIVDAIEQVLADRGVVREAAE